MELVGWIQAIANCILVIVTAFYVYFTRRLVEEANFAFIVLSRVRGSDEKYEVVIKNHGPGVAIDVELRAAFKSFEEYYYRKEDTEDTEKARIQISAEGPAVIPVNAEANYTINKGINRDDGGVPIYIKYKAISGQRFEFEWKYDPVNKPYYNLIKQHKNHCFKGRFK